MIRLILFGCLVTAMTADTARAQNLLVILGNRYSLDKIAGVKITRDDGTVIKRPIYRQIMQNIGEGGMVDGRDLL